MTLTANCILQRPVDDYAVQRSRRGSMQYSIYYGQTFDREGSCQHQRVSVYKSYYVRDLGDVSRFPEKVYLHHVVDQFEHIFEDSAASVHSIVNYVLLIRRLIEKPKSSRRRAKNQTTTISI